MRSMTGFGQAAGSNDAHAVTVTLRAVNGRFLEVKLRLGDEYRGSEAALRELLEGELQRGRVDAVVAVQAVGEREVSVHVHRRVVMAAHAALEELVEGGLIAEKLTAGDLLRLPEAMRVEVAADRWEEEDHDLLLEVAGRALAQLVESRSHEGAKLAAVLLERARELGAVVERLEALATAVREATADGLGERLEEILERFAGQDGDGEGQGAPGGGGRRRIDPGRLEQEVALLVEKGDVAEELDRLGAHLEHFRHLVEAGGAVGKRLDFLTQEILRELNTVGSKCRDAEMTRSVLDGKVLCEQLREQVQNVE